MFGKMFRAFAAGGTGAKAIQVLVKTYSLEVSHPDQLSMMSRTIKTDHPRARSEVEKYIRMSKGAYNRGLASMDGPQERLFKVARERFGIEPNDIVAV